MNLNKLFYVNNCNLLLRNIRNCDYNKGYLHLLRQLTHIEPDKICQNDFNNFINSLNKNHQILVIENTDTDTIIGTITVLIEKKLIHNMGLVCHIEDVVVNDKFRGFGIGKILLETALNYAISEKCYKTILDCSEENVGFYAKNGLFTVKGKQMAVYH